MARPSITAPIASATNLDQLEDLIAAAAPQARRRRVLKALDTASAMKGRGWYSPPPCGEGLGVGVNSQLQRPWFAPHGSAR